MKSFSRLKSIFGNKSLPEEEQRKLYEELLFLTLARASRTDLDTAQVEVDKVQTILKSNGVDASAEDVRLAAMSELFEVASIEKYLTKGGQQLSVAYRQKIVSGLLDVIKSDGNVGNAEANFFNDVSRALGLTPIQLVGVTVDE